MCAFAQDPRVARYELADRIGVAKAARRELVRRFIVQNRRFDVLAEEVLGLEVAEHHLRILKHRLKYEDANMVLAWRGSGKSTIGTSAYCIGKLLCDPDIRIAVASKSTEKAVDMLKEMRQFIKLPGFQAVFGNIVGEEWEEKRFSIRGRSRPAKEASVCALGIEAATASQHYEIVAGDDLEEDENSATEYMRKKTRRWYWNGLMPTLMPNGLVSINGTLYHPEGLHCTLAKTQMEGDRTLRIPLIYKDEEGQERSSWPARWPIEKCIEKRTGMPLQNWMLQYQMIAQVSIEGGLFDYDDFQQIPENQVPEGLPRYTGVDLAVSKMASSDRFAAVTIARDHVKNRIYIIDAFGKRLRPSDQRDYLAQVWRDRDPIKILVEAHAYQAAMVSDVKKENPGIPVFGKDDKNSKMARALRTQVLCQQKAIYYVPGTEAVVNEHVGFPDAEHDDFVDALYLAIVASNQRKKIERPEPGLLGIG